MKLQFPRFILLPLCALVAFALSPSAAHAGNPKAVPNDLALLKSFKKSWEGLSCSGELAMSLAGQSSPLVVSPMAMAFERDTLQWVAFITPPTPCAGTVVLGGVKIGLGNKPAMRMGTPPGLILGDGPATLVWKELSREATQNGQPLSVGSLCGPQASDENTEQLFGGFAAGMRQRPDKRTWDEKQPHLLKLEGRIKAEDPEDKGRYIVWLDSARGYMPVRSERHPSQGAVVTTTYEPGEVTPGRWLPIRWETSAPGKPSLIGELRQMKCDVPVPSSWFKMETYPDLSAEQPVLQQLRSR